MSKGVKTQEAKYPFELIISDFIKIGGRNTSNEGRFEE